MKPFCTMCHGPHWMVECPRLDHVAHGAPRVITRPITHQIVAPEHVRRRPLVPARTSRSVSAASAAARATPPPPHAPTPPRSTPSRAHSTGTPASPSIPASCAPLALPLALPLPASTRIAHHIAQDPAANKPEPSANAPSKNAQRQKRYRERKKLLTKDSKRKKRKEGDNAHGT